MLLCTLACVVSPARAAVSLYPNELYGGMNVVSIKASSGVRRLQWYDGDRWVDLRKGQALENLRIVAAQTQGRCPRSMNLYLFVPDVTSMARIMLRVIECGGAERTMELETGPEWLVDHQRMRDARVGETVCQEFSVRSVNDGRSVIVDRVVSPVSAFQLRFTGRRPPVRIAAGRSYYYQVCFRATAPGRFKMPIHVYIRRAQPNGGFNSFIVADTAYITVVGPPPPVPVRPRPIPARPRPVPPSTRPTPPRVRIEPPSQPVEPPPPRIPDVDTTSTRAIASAVVPVATDSLRVQPGVGEPLPWRSEVVDPTTFRTVLLPTARSVPEGVGFVGSYDIAGVLAGYGVTDRLTVLVGGLYIPPSIASRTADLTAGARYEFYRGDFTRVAAGLQLNYSDTDSSSITVAAPYVVASLGDDDRRASIALSYSARRHVPALGEPFYREAVVIAAGGDIRVGGDWKLAGEAYWIQHSTYQPVIATVRYFGRSYAIDAGVVVNAAGSEARIAPLVSVVWVFGQ